MFQASDAKSKWFLDFLDDNLQPLKLLYSNGGSWLKYFGHSNSLCTRASRAIINHALLENINLDSFLMKNLSVHAGNILLKQDNISLISVKGLITIGILDRIQ